MDDPFEDFKEILRGDSSGRAVVSRQRRQQQTLSAAAKSNVSTYQPKRAVRPQTAVGKKPLRDLPRELPTTSNGPPPSPQSSNIIGAEQGSGRAGRVGAVGGGERSNEIIIRGNKLASGPAQNIQAARKKDSGEQTLGATNMPAKPPDDTTTRANNNNNLRQQPQPQPQQQQHQALETLSEVSEELSVDWQEDEETSKLENSESSRRSSVIYENASPEQRHQRRDYLARADPSIESLSPSKESSLRPRRSSASSSASNGSNLNDENLNFASDLESSRSSESLSPPSPAPLQPSSLTGQDGDADDSKSRAGEARKKNANSPVQFSRIERKLDLFGDNLIRLVDQRLQTWTSSKVAPVAAATTTNLISSSSSSMNSKIENPNSRQRGDHNDDAGGRGTIAAAAPLNGHNNGAGRIVNKMVVPAAAAAAAAEEESNELKGIIYDSILEISQRNEHKPELGPESRASENGRADSLLSEHPPRQHRLARRTDKDDEAAGDDETGRGESEPNNKEKEKDDDDYETLVDYYKRRLAKFNEIVLINSASAMADDAYRIGLDYSVAKPPDIGGYCCGSGEDGRKLWVSDGRPSVIGLPFHQDTSELSFRSGKFKFRANSLLNSVRLASKLLDRRLLATIKSGETASIVAPTP